MTRRVRLTTPVVVWVLLVASCSESAEDNTPGAGGSQDGGATGSGARAGGGGSGGIGGGAGIAGSQGTGGSGGKGGSAGADGGGGGAGPMDGGGGARDASGGASGGAGIGGAGGVGGSLDAGREAAGGSGGASGGGGSTKDGSAGQSGSGGATGSDAGADSREAGGAGGGAKDGGPTNCPTALVGWATVGGDGVNATTGGGNAPPVRPTTVADLMAYASDASPRVIEIAGTFAVPDLEVGSNKTLLGIGNNATINGGIRIRGNSSTPVENVIVRNLRVNGATTGVDYDAVQVDYAHHVWIDHAEIWDGPDGNLDMAHAVNWVTVSWTKFRYTPSYQRPPGETSDHRFSSLIGHSDDNASEDTDRLKISFHHNWWAERVIERMPRVRFGQVHVFNNYYASTGNNYCVRAGSNAHLLVEGNYFDGVNNPHEFNSAADEMTASITARDNAYNGTTGSQVVGGGGTPFTSVPYSATIEPAGGIPALVQACAGPR